MTKKELLKKIKDKGGTAYKSWSKSRLRAELKKVEKNLSYHLSTECESPTGNWNTAKDYFPTIQVLQESRHVLIAAWETNGYQKKASVTTEWIDVEVSDDRTALYIRGEVHVKNWMKWKCSGSQRFCFAVFVGDSGHVYTHRAPASRGWMQGSPNEIRKRLRKLGIGALKGVIQQGDFLLKPANGQEHPDEMFKHERMGFGHHNFEGPTLYHDGQFFLTEPLTLKHTSTDGIQHPDVTVPAGKWIVGTTASQLSHSNARD